MLPVRSASYNPDDILPKDIRLGKTSLLLLQHGLNIHRHAWSGIVNHINYSCMLASTVYSGTLGDNQEFCPS